MKTLNVIIFSVLVLVGCGQSKDVTSSSDNQTKSTENTTATNNQPVSTSNNTNKTEVDLSKIEWLDFETAIDKNKKHKKLIFIDVYTKWCGWCKKMDATTFQNPEVIKYMNTYFYAVKMDAESKDPIAYKDKLYEWKSYGRAGYNTLAVSLLDSKMSFPSFVVLSKRETKLGKIIGYKDVNGMMAELKKYVGK